MQFDGLLLRDLRRRRALTLRDLAARSGVSYHAIHGAELGKHEPRPSTLRKLAEALGVDPEVFFSNREPFSGKATA